MTPQPTLFDATERQRQDAELKEQLDKEIAVLAERISRGEAWLKANPSHAKHAENEKLYWALVEDHSKKVVQQECLADHWKCAVMMLPPGVTWGNGQHSIVRVLWNSEPVRDDEMTYSQFGELLGTMKLTKEAMAL